MNPYLNLFRFRGLVLVILAFTCLSQNVSGQKLAALKNGTSVRVTVFTDAGKTMRTVNGQPTVDGQPYVSDIWLKGKINFANGVVKNVERLNYDLLDNMLIQFEDGIEYEVYMPVKSFELYAEESTLKFINVEGEFLELLYQDDIVILKKHKKEIQVATKYGSAWGHGSIVSKDELYYLSEDSKLVKLKSGPEVLDLFKHQKLALNEYVKEEKLNLRKNSEVEKLVRHLNTL